MLNRRDWYPVGTRRSFSELRFENVAEMQGQYGLLLGNGQARAGDHLSDVSQAQRLTFAITVRVGHAMAGVVLCARCGVGAADGPPRALWFGFITLKNKEQNNEMATERRMAKDDCGIACLGARAAREGPTCGHRCSSGADDRDDGAARAGAADDADL
jgi:hypothetical protein